MFDKCYLIGGRHLPIFEARSLAHVRFATVHAEAYGKSSVGTPLRWRLLEVTFNSPEVNKCNEVKGSLSNYLQRHPSSNDELFSLDWLNNEQELLKSFCESFSQPISVLILPLYGCDCDQSQPTSLHNLYQPTHGGKSSRKKVDIITTRLVNFYCFICF